MAPTERVYVANRKAQRDRGAVLKRRVRVLEQAVIQCVFDTVVLTDETTPAHVVGYGRIVKDRGEIDARRLPVCHVPTLHQAVHTAHHVVELAKAEVGHDPTQVLSHEKAKS